MVWLQRFVDKWIGGLLVLIAAFLKFLFVWRKPDFSKQKIKNVLFIKLWALGDSVVLLPSINAVKKKFPHAKITVLARNRNKDVFECSNDVDEIILFEPSNFFKVLSLIRKFDIVFDAEPYLNLSALFALYSGRRRIGFSHDLRSSMYTDIIEFSAEQHMVNNYLNMTEVLGAGYNKSSLLPLTASSKEKFAIEKYLKNNNIKQSHSLFGICVGVAESVKSREWSLNNFSELADALIKKYRVKIVFIGGKAEHELIEDVIKNMNCKNQAVNSAGELSLKQSFYLISKCKVFISNDTGPMHIAAAQGCKTIGLFGPNTPVLWKPYGRKNIAIYKGKHVCKYSPCIINKKGRMPECRFGENNKCMKAIKTSDVLNAVNKILK